MGGGTTYRNLAICPFPVVDRIPLEECAGAVTDEDRAVYGDWIFLMRDSNQNKAILPTLNYDTEMGAEWLKSSPYFPPPKKVGPGNRPPFPPLSYTTANFREHRLLIDDAICLQPAASVLLPTRANIVCLHMHDVDGVDGNEGEGEAQPNAEGQAQPANQAPWQGDSQNVGDSHVICTNEVAAGEYVPLIDAPKGQFFYVSANLQYEARGFVWGVAFELQS